MAAPSGRSLQRGLAAEGGVLDNYKVSNAGEAFTVTPRKPAFAVDAILAALPVLPFDDIAADACRRIVESAGYSRRKILDRMIGAQALVHRATLLTRNAADFRDVPGLHLMVW